MRLDLALRQAQIRLAEAGVPSPLADVEELAADVLGLSRGEVISSAMCGRRLEPAEAARFDELVGYRQNRVPLQHLTGRAGFRHLELRVGAGVFVPRPESEITAGLAIDAARAAHAAGAAYAAGAAAQTPLIVDLCTGSAAIALSVALEVPAARVIAVELDPRAHAWARRNIEALASGRVELRLGSAVSADTLLLADSAGRVDVVVANPPYIPDGARPLDPEVADHDPALALYGGGADGLQLPAAVVAAAAGLLRPGGVLVMEHGDQQGAATRALAASGWAQVHTVADLTGRDRVLVATRELCESCRQE